MNDFSDSFVSVECMQLSTGRVRVSVECMQLSTGRVRVSVECMQLSTGRVRVSVECMTLHATINRYIIKEGLYMDRLLYYYTNTLETIIIM